MKNHMGIGDRLDKGWCFVPLFTSEEKQLWE